MKKSTIIPLSAVMLTACMLLASCSSEPVATYVSTPSKTEAVSKAGAISTEAPIPDEEPALSSTPAEVAAAAETPADAGDVGDYYVAIKSAQLSEDYDGNPAVIVTYDFANNGEDVQMFLTAVQNIAYQDGVQLETAIPAEDYGAEEGMKNIKPGATLEVYSAFKLTSTTSPIEIEVGPLFSFESNPPKVMKTFDPAELS